MSPSSLAEGVLATIQRHALLAGGETVLVAVSGGADSVALLHVLRSLALPLRLSLHAVHVHHGLRPEADDDARFVLDLCRQWGVPAHVERVRLGATADPAGEGRDGLEAAARLVVAPVRAEVADALELDAGLRLRGRQRRLDLRAGDDLQRRRGCAYGSSVVPACGAGG